MPFRSGNTAHPPFIAGAPIVHAEVSQLRSDALLDLATAHREHFDFGFAVRALKDGQRVARAGWNGKGMWLALQVPDANSKMSLPYIYMNTVDGKLVPWLASQTDVLAEDWDIVAPQAKEAA